LKEGDVLYEKRDDSTKSMAILPRLPARLVMNDRSISLYQDDTMTNKIVTFLLNEAVFARVKDLPNCFKIKSTLREELICQIEAPKHGDFVEEWDYDFNLFKNQCFKKRQRSSNILKAEEEKLEKKFEEQVNSLKLDIVAEKAEVIKKEIEKDEEVKLTSKVETARTTSMMAIQKETKLEELLEREESSKEDNETETLTIQMTEEKKKEECFLKALKEKEIENQFNIAKRQAEKQISNIQEDTKKQIATKREDVKRRIANMRKKQERKKMQIKGEIMSIRATIAEKLSLINKSGNMKNCFSPVESDSPKVEDYCNQNHPDDFTKLHNCKDLSSFCYVCCETEFGELNVVERDTCYANCDGTKAAPAS